MVGWERQTATNDHLEPLEVTSAVKDLYRR